jgi:hypothetical protein
MSLEDDVRKGIKEGLEDYNTKQEWRARSAANRADQEARRFERQLENDRRVCEMQEKTRELIQNGDYPEAVRIAWSIFRIHSDHDQMWSGIAILNEALWKWGKACEQGSEKYPRTKPKPLNS